MRQIRTKIPNLVVMIRPDHFGYNSETVNSNCFQHSVDISYETVLKEFDEVVSSLQEAGIHVEVFQDQKKNVCPDAIFPNNWMAQIPQKEVTIFPMLAENRQHEVREDIIHWVMEKTGEKDLNDLRMGHERRVLEGTGSIVFDHFSRTAYAAESPRTDVTLFEAYCERIGYRPISFESLDLSGEPIYHTNVMMSIAQNFVIVNEESIANPVERMMLRKSIEQSGKIMISVTYPQMANFAGNVLEVLSDTGEMILIMSKCAYKAFTTEQLGIILTYNRIVTADLPFIQKIGGGGIRCMLLGLFLSYE